MTLTPEKATRADVERLREAGLDDRDVVTLAGLIAYVNYQIRVVAGLRMLKGDIMTDAVHDWTLDELEWHPYLAPIASRRGDAGAARGA